MKHKNSGSVIASELSSVNTAKPSGKSLMNLSSDNIRWVVGVLGGRNESGQGAVVLRKLKQVWAGSGQPEL